MNLTIKPIDADNAKGYVNNQDCLGATAVKRVFQTQDVTCTRKYLVVNGTRYIMSENLSDFLRQWPDYLNLNKYKREAAAVKAQLPKTFRLRKAKCQ